MKGQAKMKFQKKTGKNGWQPKFDGKSGELKAALYYTKEVFEAAQIPFFCLGEMARQMRDKEELRQLPAITVGILKKHLTQDTRKTLAMILKGSSLARSRADWEIGENLISFDYVPEPMKKHPVVPIKVKVLSVHHKHFDFPDTIFYDYTEYKMPNNFEKYFRMKGMVR